MFPSYSDCNTKVALETGLIQIPDDLPFHILLLGDWSGKESRNDESDLLDSNPIEIDRDNFDEVLKKMSVRLNLDFQTDDENVLTIHFNELEDFHPDKIFQQLPIFAELRDVRQRLLVSSTFKAAAVKVRSWFIETENQSGIENPPQNAINKEYEGLPGDLLNQILGQTDEKVTKFQRQNKEPSELNEFIKKVVKPHLLEIDTTEQAELLLVIDEVISDIMRMILNHPRFQALESAWRGAFLVVRRAATDSNLKIYLLDVSKSKLSSNLKSVNDLMTSNFYQCLTEKGIPWSVICANYTFSLNVDDSATLFRLAKIACDTVTPFVSHIKPELFGLKTFEEIQNIDQLRVIEGSTEDKLWTMLRTMPEAEYLSLVMPRVLIRLPYGEKTDPTETFYFEEFTEDTRHQNYLWANPIFIGASLLAKTFSEYSWNISQNFIQDFDGLPIHLYKDEYENKTKPCAEILMTQNKCEKIMEQGLMPLISFKDTDRIRLGSLQSIAYPPALLKGKWK